MEQIFADWRSLMAGIQVWLAGGNPYGVYPHPLGYPVHAGWYSYPPPTLLLGTPLALLPWQLSGPLMLLVALVAFELWVRRASGRIGLPWLLLWLPFTQGLWIGQTTMLALLGLVWAERCYRQGRERQAGLLLALAMLKPQIGVLAAGWLLLEAVRARRWRLPLTFAAVTASLYAAALLVAGPQIYAQWFGGLTGYRAALPDRPLLFPPLGPALGLLAGLFWWRHGRRDHFGGLLLLNTLLYPLSVIYIAVGIAFVVVRWRPDWPWYPLLLSWVVAFAFPLAVRSPENVAALTQSIIASGLLAGLLPRLPLPARWRNLRPVA